MKELRSASNPMGPWDVAKDFHIPEGFADCSYENDVNPSVYHLKTGHTIHWDTEDNANMRREGVEGTERFFVLHDKTFETLYQGNDLQQAILAASKSHNTELL